MPEQQGGREMGSCGVLDGDVGTTVGWFLGSKFAISSPHPNIGKKGREQGEGPYLAAAVVIMREYPRSSCVCFLPPPPKNIKREGKKKAFSWLVLAVRAQGSSMTEIPPQHSGGAQHEQLCSSPAVLVRRRCSFV